MKLIFCPNCYDIIKMTNKINGNRYCACGLSYGRCEDGYSIIINEHAIPIAIMNTSLVLALHNRTLTCPGPNFDAFVCPYDHNSVTVEKKSILTFFKKNVKMKTGREK